MAYELLKSCLSTVIYWRSLRLCFVSEAFPNKTTLRGIRTADSEGASVLVVGHQSSSLPSAEIGSWCLLNHLPAATLTTFVNECYYCTCEVVKTGFDITVRMLCPDLITLWCSVSFDCLGVDRS